MKCPQVTKFVEEIEFDQVWGELDEKKMFPETTIHKIFETDSNFHVK